MTIKQSWIEKRMALICLIIRPGYVSNFILCVVVIPTIMEILEKQPFFKVTMIPYAHKFLKDLNFMFSGVVITFVLYLSFKSQGFGFCG